MGVAPKNLSTQVHFPPAPVGYLLYTSDAADDLIGGDLGGRRILKKKTMS